MDTTMSWALCGGERGWIYARKMCGRYEVAACCGCEITEYNVETTVHVVDNDDETCPGISLTI